MILKPIQCLQFLFQTQLTEEGEVVVVEVVVVAEVDEVTYIVHIVSEMDTLKIGVIPYMDSQIKLPI